MVDLLLCPYEPATSPYPEWNELSPRRIYTKSASILSIHRCFGLQSGPFQADSYRNTISLHVFGVCLYFWLQCICLFFTKKLANYSSRKIWCFNGEWIIIKSFRVISCDWYTTQLIYGRKDTISLSCKPFWIVENFHELKLGWVMEVKFPD